MNTSDIKYLVVLALGYTAYHYPIILLYLLLCVLIVITCISAVIWILLNRATVTKRDHILSMMFDIVKKSTERRLQGSDFVDLANSFIE